MILVCGSFRICSLKSFCAKRQALGGALQGCACVPTLGIGCITPPCVLFHSSRWVASNFLKYVIIFGTEVIVPPCGFSGDRSVSIQPHCVYFSSDNQIYSFPTAIKSLDISYFIFYAKSLGMLVQFKIKRSYAEHVKRAGRGGRGLDLEAKGGGSGTEVFYFSRRNAVEGLDRLVTVGMAEDSPFGL